MLPDSAGSRPPGDPGAVEELARTVRRAAGRLTAIDIADVGTWRGYGAEQATGLLRGAGTGLSTVADDLRALAATLDRAADELRRDQRAWDKRAADRRTRH